MDAPAVSEEKLNKIFPAARPSRLGWLRYLNGLTPWHEEHCCSAVTIVPVWYMLTLGFPPSHLKQKTENRARREL
jgi:hypothetical protein